MATGRRRGRAFIYVALILILLLVLLYAVVQYNIGGFFGTGTPAQPGVQGPNPTATPTPADVSIVVSSADISRGSEINPDQLELAPIPRAQYSEEQFFTTKEEVTAVRGRALADFKRGMPLRKDQVYLPGVSDRLAAFEIPTGKVAISVPISRLSSVAFGLQRGDHVNVLVSLLMVDLDTNWQSITPNRTGYILAAGPKKEDTQTYLTSRNFMAPEYTSAGGEALSFFGRVEIEPTTNNPIWVVPGERQRPRLVSQTLLQDVVILQMGNFETSTTPALTAPSAEATPVPGAQPAQQQGQAEAAPAPAGPDIVTLIVDPQDAVTLNYLMLAGAKLNLVMRSAGDNKQTETEAVTLQFVLDQYRIPNPAKLPYGTEPRIDAFPNNVLPFAEPGPTPTPVQ